MEIRTLAERASVTYATVGRGRCVHYSPRNDDTLCSREVGEYLDLLEASDLLDERGHKMCATCTRAARKRAESAEQALVAEQHQEQLTRDEPSDTWTIATRAGVEIARVEGATAEDMTRAAEALPEVRANIQREGGFTRRRLYTSELAPADAKQVPGAAGAEQQPTAEVERRIVEGVVVEHGGTAEGSLPRHAQHPDVVAARAILRPLKPAILADHTDTSRGADEVDTSVRGYMLDPRGQGRVAAYWIEGGQDTLRGEPHVGELEILRLKFIDADWRVEPMSRTCVFAWRPAEGDAPRRADAACQEAGRALRARRTQQRQAAPEAAEVYVAETPDTAGTWRSGWIAAGQQAANDALFDLGDSAEQGALFG
ncbi:hypothetical protein QZH56_15420 [Streptomyces olivoreticuli]|uniref:hypothetical protein n=1 Tax=Streptomyces olivoreticuli TaxID=68246 RepID=UPI00265AA1A7|nr:hypothetical protein [Streptomyces olivoreticuli]WKK26856.1 hypothetical protein QZH56_15420 [Streptomyces olivoreticuli]